MCVLLITDGPYQRGRFIRIERATSQTGWLLDREAHQRGGLIREEGLLERGAYQKGRLIREGGSLEGAYQRGVRSGHNRELKIYDAAGSTTRLRTKTICHARQKLSIICGPRGILNGFVTLNTTLNQALSRLRSNGKAYRDPRDVT